MHLGVLVLAIAFRTAAQAQDWEGVKVRLDDQLHQQGGLGLLVEISRRGPTEVGLKYLERGSSDSAWRLEAAPVCEGLPESAKPEALMEREGGYTVMQTRPVESKLAIPAGCGKVKLLLRSSRWGGRGWVLELPAELGAKKTTFLHLPDPARMPKPAPVQGAGH